jgi:hypothetical protein
MVKQIGKIVMLKRNVPDLRAAVKKEMDRRGWTPYRLVKELRGKRSDGTNVPTTTVYEFVNEGTPINSRDLGLIFDVLDLKPVAKH